MNEVLIHATWWINLKNSMLSKKKSHKFHPYEMSRKKSHKVSKKKKS